jgi:hypothetical protein
MDTSIFSNKSVVPDDEMLISAIGSSKSTWDVIREFVHSQYPAAISEWKYPGQKYGWSFRLKDKKRVIIYLLPREGSFLVAFMFGEKAYRQIMESSVSQDIKQGLSEAKVYAEGRGIRLEANSGSIEDIKTLILIKLKN